MADLFLKVDYVLSKHGRCIMLRFVRHKSSPS